MTRRAKQRQYAILGVLHEHGPQYELGLCKLLGRWPGTIYPDLADLERESFVVGEWEDDFLARTTQTMPAHPPTPGTPGRRIYRLASQAERQRGRRIGRQVEQEIADRVAARSKPRRRWSKSAIDGAA